jgi:hypothetical protein
MRELDKFLKALSDGMKTLAQGVEAIAEKVDALSKAQRAEKPTPKPSSEPSAKEAVKKAAKTSAPQKEKKATATGTVLQIISRSKNGVDTATLKKKTGFNDKKIHNIIYKLKNKGEIKSEKKGIYVKA